MSFEISQLKARTDIVEVVGRRVSLAKRGQEWVGICPFHNDTKASLQVNEKKQVFACFACGKSGDVLDFLTEMGATFPEAVAELSGEALNTHTPEKVHIDRKKPVQWQRATPVPTPGQIVHYRYGAPSRVWEYRTADGQLDGLICRFDTPEGKQIVPYTFRTDGTRREWRWQGFDVPRPLYQLDRIAGNPAATVLIVEGEKAADAAQSLLPHVVATCWQGGARAVHNTDWGPLAGRKVVIWPDNDAPGVMAMLDVWAAIREKCPAVKWITNAPELPEKWDIADAEWTADQALAYVRAHIGNVPNAGSAAPGMSTQGGDDAPPMPEPPELEYNPPPDDFGADAEDMREDPFRVLGFFKQDEQTVYAFFSELQHQVHVLKPSSLTAPNLLLLAPLDYWQTYFPKSKSKSSFDVETAMNWLMRQGDQAGVYSPTNTRGRGAWMDSGRVVIHHGDGLVVDGRRHRLGGIDTRYMYEASTPLSFPTENPLTNKEANRLMEVMGLVNWERPVNAHLLAGWCVIAPICGALKWRPHVWITGAAGTGKSWVFNQIVRRLLGRNVLAVQSETSEAGIRQTIKNDALPIVFDEAEGEDKRSRERMEAVLSLMRASSAEDGGVMLKGSAGGRAQMYRIRSCFAFASIGVQITQASDRGRVSILALNKPSDAVRAERWEKLKVLHREIITPEFVKRLQARTVSIMPVILHNADTFADAVAYELGEQRAGDQLGALLAGAYSLFSSNEIQFDAAVEWVKGQNWEEERGSDLSRDETVLLARLTDQIVRVDGPNLERTVGELVLIASNEVFDDVISSKVAHDRLLRMGFKVDGDFFFVSQSHHAVLKALENSPWVKSVGRTLLRIDGAVQITSARFGPGHQSRAVRVPIERLK
jgi:putative DNA primase/helicase